MENPHLYDPVVRALENPESAQAVSDAVRAAPWYEQDTNGVLVPLCFDYCDALCQGISSRPADPAAIAAYTAAAWILRSHGVHVETSERLPAWAVALNKALDGPPGRGVVPRELFKTSSPLAPPVVARALAAGINAALKGVELGPTDKRLAVCPPGTPETAKTLLCVAARHARPPRLPELPRELWLLFVEYAAMHDLFTVD